MDGWDGIYLRQLGTLEHLAVLKKIDHEFMGNFGPVISPKYGPKTAPNEPNFKNWLKTHPKVINA